MSVDGGVPGDIMVELPEEAWRMCAGVAEANALYVFVEGTDVLELIRDPDGASREAISSFSRVGPLM